MAKPRVLVDVEYLAKAKASGLRRHPFLTGVMSAARRVREASFVVRRAPRPTNTRDKEGAPPACGPVRAGRKLYGHGNQPKVRLLSKNSKR